MSLAALLALVLGLPVQAQQLRLLAVRTEPWVYHSPDCELRGIIPEFFARVASASGLRIALELVSPSEWQRSIRSGSGDLWLMPIKTANELAEFGRPVVHLVDMSVIVLGLSDATASTLHGRRLASLGQYLTFSRTVGAEHVATDSYGEAFQLLATNEVDGVLGNGTAVTFICLLAGCDESVFGSRIELDQAQFWLFRSHESDGGISDEAIRDAIQPLLDRGLVQFLRSKYLNPHVLGEVVPGARCGVGGKEHPLPGRVPSPRRE